MWYASSAGLSLKKSWERLPTAIVSEESSYSRDRISERQDENKIVAPFRPNHIFAGLSAMGTNRRSWRDGGGPQPGRCP